MALQLRAVELYDVPTAKMAVIEGMAATGDGEPTKSNKSNCNNSQEGRQPHSTGNPCRNFAAGKCRHGDKCWNMHDAKSNDEKDKKQNVTNENAKKPCFHWQQGNCKFGDKCRYNHDPEERGTKPKEQSKTDAEDRITDSVRAQLGKIPCPNKQQTGNCQLDPCPFAHQAHADCAMVAGYQARAAFATAAYYHGNGSTNFEPAMAPQPQSSETPKK
jgi:hypothetical protein